MNKITAVFWICGILPAASLIIFGLNLGCSGPSVKVPGTPQMPVTDTYHGVEVIDNYRWLENLDDPTVTRWVDAQNQYARSILDNIPSREMIYVRLKELFDNQSAEYSKLKHVDGMLFALKYQPPLEQPLLVTLESANNLESERVVVDVNKLNPEGTTSIDFYVPSPDGKLVAVSLSEGGSEEGTLHIYETATGQELGDVIPRVNGPTAGGSVAWISDGSAFYYTRYPAPGERPEEDLSFFQQVYFHKIGSPTGDDKYIVGQDFPRIAEIELEMSGAGRYLLVIVSNGDGGEYAHYLIEPSSGKSMQITQFKDKITRATFGKGADKSLYMLSLDGSPRGKIVRLALNNPDLKKAVMVVSQDSVVIKDFLPTDTRLYVQDLIGGPSQIRVFDLKGRPQGIVEIMPVSSVGGMLDIDGDKILYNNQSYVSPPVWYEYDPSLAKSMATALAVTSPADFSDVEVIREFATSKDGTKVPINIMMLKGTKLDGQNPTLLYGYGGYSISMSPWFEAEHRLWLEHGCIYAVANIRGGGEYGEEWHLGGNLTKKQNVFDDFIACAEHLIEKKYTNPQRLAIEGGSNGGLLMGAVLTQRPDLFKAVVARAGVFDMLRVELDPNGAFNVTEYGSVQDPEQFNALYGYSPYHHVVDGVTYPAVLFTIGMNDGRVNPANSMKMTAALQAATGSKGNILLRSSSRVGHSMGTSLSDKLATRTDVYTFLCHYLGMIAATPQ